MSRTERYSGRSEFDPEHLIAMMRETPRAEAMHLVESMPVSARARMAVFFYQRRHLRGMGLDIARTCPKSALLEAAGGAGETIYAQSRNPQETLGAGQFADERTSKPKHISLAGTR